MEVADPDEPTPVVIKVVVSPIEVRVAVRVDIRKVGIAVRIHPRGIVPDTICATTHRILFGLYRIWDIKVRQYRIPSNIHF